MEDARSAVIERDDATRSRRELAGQVTTMMARRWQGRDALDEACQYAVSGGGKLFRPILLVESALAVGGRVEHVLPAAVGAEGGHVASLVHDDIIDHDDIRRGRPSVHRVFSVDYAIVAGDALIFDLFAALAECREAGAAESRIVSALGAVARAGVDMCRGQVLEAEVAAQRRFDAESYLRVAALKTAALFRGACQSGALLGGGDDTQVTALGEYGEHLGRAFQIKDDLLAFTADEATVGKPGASDLRNSRMTAPIVLAHRLGGETERRWLETLLSRQSEADLAELRALVEQTGAVVATAEWAAEWARAAQLALGAVPESAHRAVLTRYADAAITRDR